jgi:CBS-domain-containing membrane protein
MFARCRENARRLRKHAVYAALSSAAVMAIIGVLGLWLDQPILFPSLGPTIFLQTVMPNEPGARLWNTLVGHAIGIAVGFAMLFLLGPIGISSVDMGHLVTGRVAATAAAVGVTIAVQFALKAEHPPAAATTMLISLGSVEPDLRTVGVLSLGIVLVAAFGEMVRRCNPALSG